MTKKQFPIRLYITAQQDTDESEFFLAAETPEEAVEHVGAGETILAGVYEFKGTYELRKSVIVKALGKSSKGYKKGKKRG